MCIFDFVRKSFIVGFVGDLGLQLVVKEKNDIVGLKKYYENINDVLGSAFLAGGMVAGFSQLYEISGLPINNYYLFAYGAFLDFLFRNFKLMPSLNNTYYKNIGQINSLFWGGLPFVIANVTPDFNIM